jgi:dethiobiotin synthetase
VTSDARISPGLFIVGSDTGVGKTTVASGLARLARRRGRVVVPYKPVETGCAPDPLDALRLLNAAQAPTTLAETCPFPLKLPAAPAAAAAAEGIRLDIDDLAARAAALATRGDFLLVEGAGGLLAPYAPGHTNADLVERLGLPILVVGRTALGTINHVALTVRELRHRGLEIAGLLLVRTTSSIEPHEQWNDRLLEDTVGLRPNATLPFLPGPVLANADFLADALRDLIPEYILTAWL